ncbi:MAG TPA: hypothetical protein VFF73_34245 [Planctomycetota bacterium]|nr:hypothetical protein [Planctomycetota bacterium]
MKKLGFAALVLVLGLAGHAFSDDPKPEKKETRSVPGWTTLTGLVGEWEGKMGDMKMTTTFELTGGGTALLETHDGCHGGKMSTVYHADKDHLVLTHYCAAGNQPRMKATKVSEGEVVFDFLDVTNLEKPTDPHMRAVTIHVKDAKHYTEEWTFRQDGKDEKKVLSFERTK